MFEPGCQTYHKLIFMTLTELRYIVILAREKHFGRAAKQCFVSQPTLSIAIKKLEEEIGLQIFERNRQSVQPTPEGLPLIAQAQKVLDEAEHFKQLATEHQDQLSTPLRVGAIYTIGPYLFPHLIQELKQIAPTMPLFIEENFTSVLRKKLSQGELDLIIVALPFSEPNVLTKELYEEPFTVLLPTDHPWSSHSQVEPENIEQKNMLLLGEGHCFRDQVINACPKLSKNDSQEQGLYSTEGSSLETMKQMVASGLGITILPMSATGSEIEDNPYLVQKPFTQPTPSRTVALAWRHSFTRPQAVDVIYRAINKCSLGEPSPDSA